jgi:nitroimidazol reductase NimA-like FMN-containing flavoprotein (pyridoxamine 5'-phosphate oxidase superfamily)
MPEKPMTDTPVSTALEPTVDRPGIPAEYGTSKAKEFLPWSHVEERLNRDRIYWVATVGANGRPRVRPIDGVYVDNAIWVGGSPKVRWIGELAANPQVSVHLADVDDVVILDGEAEILETVDGDLAERLAAASNAKFPEYGMKANFYRSNGAIAIRLRKAIAWTDITRNPTRFRFER